MTLRRRGDWDRRLRAYFERTRTAALMWSVHDCAAWPLGAIDAMCDTTHAVELAGAYDSFETAVTYCAGRGWPTLLEAAVAVGCLPIHNVLLTQRGDVVFLPPTDRVPDEPGFHAPTLGILLLNVDGSIYVPSPTGLRRYLPQAAARVAGAIGLQVGR